MAMHRQFVLASGALLVCVLILVDLHLAMHRIQDVDEDVHMKLATLDKRLRQMPSTHALIDALLSRNGRGVDANATPAVFPPAIAAESRALGGALEDLKRHHLALFQADLDRLGLATMATGNPSPRTGSFKMVMAASKALEIGHSIGAVPTVAAPAAPGCSGVGGKEPRVQWGGDWVDFGPPASVSLVRTRLDQAVEAGLQYAKWERWHWMQSCGSQWEHVGSHIRPGSDRSRIKYVRIWGERNSCTTMVTELLSRNLDLKCDGTASCVSGGLPNKHDFMRGANVHDEGETLHILVSRHPLEWLSSMRRHPFYAGLHYDKTMPEFLTQEWASFRLRDLDDATNKLSPASPRANGNMTLEWGRARSVGACSSGGKLRRMEECYSTSPPVAAMRCTRIPGLAPGMFKNDADGGAEMLRGAKARCENATQSLRNCPDHSFLCRDAHMQQWDESGWRVHLEGALHTRAGMHSLGNVTERTGMSCYRKIRGTVIKISDAFCGAHKDLDAEAFGKWDLFECAK